MQHCLLSFPSVELQPAFHRSPPGSECCCRHDSLTLLRRGRCRWSGRRALTRWERRHLSLQGHSGLSLRCQQLLSLLKSRRCPLRSSTRPWCSGKVWASGSHGSRSYSLRHIQGMSKTQASKYFFYCDSGQTVYIGCCWPVLSRCSPTSRTVSICIIICEG